MNGGFADLVATWIVLLASEYIGALGVAVFVRRGFLPLHVAAVAGASAYGFAAVCSHTHPAIAIAIGCGAGVLLSLVGASIFLRVRRVGAALATIAIQALFDQYVRTAHWTGGTQGLWQGIPLVPPSLLAAFALATAATASWLFARFVASDASILIAVDGCAPDLQAAAGNGSRVIALGWSSALAGVFACAAGVLTALQVGFVSPSIFSLAQGLSLVAVVVMAGADRWARILFSAAVVALLPEALRLAGFGTAEASAWRGVAIGALVVVMAFAQAPRIGAQS